MITGIPKWIGGKDLWLDTRTSALPSMSMFDGLLMTQSDGRLSRGSVQIIFHFKLRILMCIRSWYPLNDPAVHSN